MYVSYKSLVNYLSLPKLSLHQLSQKLTSLGLETETYLEGLKFTPFPNRPDLFSFWGISQEISVLLNCPLSLPTIKERKETRGEIKIRIETEKCLEIHLGIIQKIKIQTSPQWIKDELEANNIRSINNLVDISNWIMLETGQPIHIYDYNLLFSKEIIVRLSNKGEKMKVINGAEVNLTEKDLVVATKNKIISLAGIIGGQETMVNENTTNILIEVAVFNPQLIKATASRLNIATRASQNFQKEVNLFNAKKVLLRTIDLIKEVLPLSLESEITSFCQEVPKKNQTIAISQQFIEQKIGKKIEPDEIERIWKRLKLPFKKIVD